MGGWSTNHDAEQGEEEGWDLEDTGLKQHVAPPLPAQGDKVTAQQPSRKRKEKRLHTFYLLSFKLL